MAPRLFIGTSGWSYPSWKPGFYPDGTAAKKFLSYYSSKLTSVEVNYTFGSVLKPGQLTGWLEQTGPQFRFTFKAPQQITHFKRLRESHHAVAEFFDTLQPAAVAGKLGLVLFQLPPNFKADVDRLRSFLTAPAFLAEKRPAIAFEFRHESWFGEETYAVLRERNAALCIAETDDLSTPEIHTAVGYTCFRLRRTGGYTPKQIAGLAKRFQILAKDREVFAYFRHEDEPTGALNAAKLLQKVAK